MTESQQGLAERHKGLALYFARPWTRRLPTHADDLQGAALVGLVKAACAWDPAADPPFPLFARDPIRSELRSYVRQQRPRGCRTSLAIVAPHTAPLVGDPVDHRSAPVGRAADDLDALESLLRKLPKPLSMVCHALYVVGQSRSALAHAIGCSRTSVNRLHEQAMTRLRADLISPGRGPAPPRPASAGCRAPDR